MSYPLIVIVVIGIIGVAVGLMWWVSLWEYPDDDFDNEFYGGER